MKIKISIIVPMYNVERYLDKCLNSLVNQTLNEIEILLINDGSTDNTKDIALDYQKKYPKIIKVIDKENGGQGSARNMGLDIATGEYISFIDSDDYIEFTMMEKLYDYAKKNKLDIALCGFNYAYSYGLKESHLFNKTRKITDKEYILSDPAPWNKLYKTSLLKKINFKFKEKIIYEDFAIIPTLAIYTNKIGYLDELLYYYVQHENSTINIDKYKPKINDIFIAVEDLYNTFLNNNILDEYKSEVEFLFIKHFLIAGNYRFNKYKESKHQVKEVKKVMKDKFTDWKKNKYLKTLSFKHRLLAYLFYDNLSFLAFILYRISKKVNNG